MAQFTKVNGDYQQVFHLDSPGYTNNGLNATSANVVVQPQGPKLDFITITASGSSSFSGTQVNVMVETVQQLATIYLYQYSNTAPDTFAFACYPAGAWSNVDPSGSLTSPANVVAAINAALTAAGVANTTAGTLGATFVASADVP
jgi:hypothetical protein